MSNSTNTPDPTPRAPVAPLAETMDVEASDLTGDLFGETPAEAEETEKEEKKEDEDGDGDGDGEGDVEEKFEEGNEESGESSMALAVVVDNSANEVVPEKKELTFIE
jgi:hypothetical protein